MGNQSQINIFHLSLLTIVVAALVYSGIQPFDRATWVMEVLPVMIVLPVLVSTYKKFPLTDMLYGLIFIHALVLILGGYYTYARVPLGFQIADWLDLQRNPYDKIGHFLKGLVPALAAREIFISGQYVQPRTMCHFLVVCVALAVSAVYELLEWLAAIMMEQGADEFLGTQGDVWDTQSDIFCALLGALVVITLLAKWHDRQINRTNH